MYTLNKSNYRPFSDESHPIGISGRAVGLQNKRSEGGKRDNNDDPFAPLAALHTHLLTVSVLLKIASISNDHITMSDIAPDDFSRPRESRTAY